MARRRPHIQQKQLVYWAGEGRSERGYARWVNRLASIQQIPLSISAESLAGGDPLDVMEQAVTKLEAIERRRGRYSTRILQVDDDLRGRNTGRDDRMEELADQHGFHIIWQPCCHEGFLLRHIAETQELRPPNSVEAIRHLKRAWPSYQKGQDAIGYEQKLDFSNLRIACQNHAGLRRAFNLMGWGLGTRE